MRCVLRWCGTSHRAGDHYLRLLLEDDPNTTRIKNPLTFFNDLYHRFLLSLNTNMKALCLQVVPYMGCYFSHPQAMTVVYTSCHEAIGSFNDTEYIVHMLNRVRCDDVLHRSLIDGSARTRRSATVCSAS